MSWFKSGAIILVLAVPFFAYAGWQVQSASRLDLVSGDPPAEKEAPPKEQQAAAKTKAEKWASDVRTVQSVALQFRQPGPGDAVSDDFKPVMSALTKRAGELKNLDMFVSDSDSPMYIKTGSGLSDRYEDWQKGKKQRDAEAQAIENWLSNASSVDGVDGPSTAAAAVAVFQRLLNAYSSSRFAEPARTAEWKLRCRIEVIQKLDAVAADPYKQVVVMPLRKINGSNDAIVKKALGAPSAIADQARRLQEDRDRARGLKIPDSVLTQADSAAQLANKWAAREQVLALYAEPTLFTKADGASEWLKKVQDVYLKTNLADDKARLRDKVQEFCEEFIPAEAALDDHILWKGKEYARGDVQIIAPQASKGGAVGNEPPLSRDPAGVNEFNVGKKYEGVTGADIKCKGEPGVFADLQPTPLSKAALDYLKARAGVLSGTGTSKWSANSVEELKNKCSTNKLLLNQLKAPGARTETLQLWDRLQNLADGARACPLLFSTTD